jgi:hypothetical protein
MHKLLAQASSLRQTCHLECDMTRTPLNSKINAQRDEEIDGGMDKKVQRTPLANKAIREKTPLKNKIITDPTPLNQTALAATVDQHLLDVMQSLNMAVAVVAQARDKRFQDPATMVSPRSVHEAMLHLKNAAQRLDLLRRSLGK